MSTEQTDWQKLCRELVDELHNYSSANPHHDSDALVARARAALASTPTDEPGRDPLQDALERMRAVVREANTAFKPLAELLDSLAAACGGGGAMISISSLEGRIGEFWWINAQPSEWAAGESLIPGSKRRFVFWGGCGFGRDLKVRFEPMPSGKVQP